MPGLRPITGEGRRMAQHGSAAQLSSLPSPRFPSTRPVGLVAESPSILIIDHDPQVRGLLRQTLEGAGFRVVEVCDGRDGIEQYERAPTDMIIVELLLPDIDGLDVMLELSWDYPDLKVLAITHGRGHLDFLDVAKKFGACQTLKKPLRPDQLLRAVRAVLQTV